MGDGEVVVTMLTGVVWDDPHATSVNTQLAAPQDKSFPIDINLLRK